MYNLASHSNSSSPTWHSSRYSSEIDFIWAYHTILTYLTSFSTDDADSSSLSDHKILISRWSFLYAQHGQCRHKTRTRRRVFNYKIMSDTKWEEFSNQVNSNLNLNSTLVLLILLNLSKQPGTKFTLVSSQLHYNIFPTKNIQSVTSNTSFPRKQHIYTPISKNLAMLFDTLNLLLNILLLFLSILTLLSPRLTTLLV